MYHIKDMFNACLLIYFLTRGNSPYLMYFVRTHDKACKKKAHPHVELILTGNIPSYKFCFFGKYYHY